MVVARQCCGINVKPVISLGAESTDERGVLSRSGLCVVETTSCGLGICHVPFYNFLLCVCVCGGSINYGGMVELSVK